MMFMMLLFIVLIEFHCYSGKAVYNNSEYIPLLDNKGAVLTAHIDVSDFNEKMEKFVSDQVPAEITGNIEQYINSDRFKSLVRNESKNDIKDFATQLINDLFNNFILSDKFKRNFTTYAEGQLKENFDMYVNRKDFKEFLQNEAQGEIKKLSLNLAVETQSLKQQFEDMKKELDTLKSNKTIEDSKTATENEMLKNKVENLQKIVMNCLQCFNGGRCIKKNNSYKCLCNDGYLGRFCEKSDGRGKAFIVIFAKIDREGSVFSHRPILLLTANRSTDVFITYFNSPNTSLQLTNGFEEYDLGYDVKMSDGLNSEGVEVSSNSLVTIRGFQIHPNACEGFLAIPSKFASTQYIIPSFPTSWSRETYVQRDSLFSISPIYSNTAVSISLRMKAGQLQYNNARYSNNQTITLTLDKRTVFQLSHSSDLTGTMITASQPVVVLSGCKCNNLGTVSGGCQPFIEMIRPVNQLDHMYIIPKLKTRLKSTVRILAVKHTNVTIQNHNGTIYKNIESRGYIDFIHTDISRVHASTDVMVILYPHAKNEDGAEGDAFMMTIPGRNQYLYDYDFIVPSQLPFDSYLSITIRSSAVGGLILDNLPLQNLNLFNVSLKNETYSSLSFEISSGHHRIIHNSQVEFGLWVYGDRYYDAYGFPAGASFKTTV